MNINQQITQLKELVESVNSVIQQQHTSSSTTAQSLLYELVNKLTILYNSFSQYFTSNSSVIINKSTLQKDIRKEANKLWNIVVKNNHQLDNAIQIQLRHLSCLLLQLQPLDIDFNLIKMISKTARLIDETNGSLNTTFTSNNSIKITSKELYEQANSLLQSIEKRISTDQSKREFVLTSKIVYLYQLHSSWDFGEIDNSWVFYNKLKSNLTALNHLGKEHCEEIQCCVYNRAKELFEKQIYQESINWMKEYLYLLHSNNNNNNQNEEEKKYFQKLQQEGYEIISCCYFSLENYEESLKYCEKCIEIERNEKNELLQIKNNFLLSMNINQSSTDQFQLKEKKDIERSIKNYILNTSNSLSSKRELVNFLFTNTTTSNNTNNINTNYKEVLIFCFEQLLTSITSQKQIDSSSFYSLFTNYLSFLFSSSTTNIILVQNALSLFVNILQKFTEENPQLLDKNAIRKIIVLLWERGVSDCIAKNERIGKEWFCKVEELLLLSQMTEEICEIKKNISLCEYSLGNYKEAIVKSKEAIQLGCSKMEAEFVLFASLVKLGKKEEAITEMINAINGISITNNSNNSNYNNFHTNNNEMEIEEIKEIDTNETNVNNNEIHQIQKENTPQEKIEYI